MKILDLEQGSPEWLSWRKTVITATDCPAILGSSPWSTAYKCWQRKLDLIEAQTPNDAMKRGNLLEPDARAQFIERYGINMIPAVVESSELNFLGASLDGISDCKNYILEIKCGGNNLHRLALAGQIPDYYRDQIQHQLFVTGAEKCFYYSYNGKDGICIEVYPDPNFASTFLPIARAFWKNVAFHEPPALVDSDLKDMGDNLEWQENVRVYQETDTSIKILEDTRESAKKKLIEICGDHSCIGKGLKVLKVISRGRIAYDEIPELKKLDLDKYRKSASTYWKISPTL